jgi:hypothetical protein
VEIRTTSGRVVDSEDTSKDALLASVTTSKSGSLPRSFFKPSLKMECGSAIATRITFGAMALCDANPLIGVGRATADN